MGTEDSAGFHGGPVVAAPGKVGHGAATPGNGGRTFPNGVLHRTGTGSGKQGYLLESESLTGDHKTAGVHQFGQHGACQFHLQFASFGLVRIFRSGKCRPATVGNPNLDLIGGTVKGQGQNCPLLYGSPIVTAPGEGRHGTFGTGRAATPVNGHVAFPDGFTLFSCTELDEGDTSNFHITVTVDDEGTTPTDILSEGGQHFFGDIEREGLGAAREALILLDFITTVQFIEGEAAPVAIDQLQIPPTGFRSRVVDLHYITHFGAQGFPDEAVVAEGDTSPAVDDLAALPDEGLRERSRNGEGNGPGEFGAVHQEHGEAVNARAKTLRDTEGHGVIGTQGKVGYALALDVKLVNLEEVPTMDADIVTQADGSLVEGNGNSFIIRNLNGSGHGFITGSGSKGERTGISLVGYVHGYVHSAVLKDFKVEFAVDEALFLIADNNAGHEIQVRTGDNHDAFTGNGFHDIGSDDNGLHYLNIFTVSLLAGLKGNGDGTVLGSIGHGGQNLAAIQIPGRNLRAREFHLGYQIQVGSGDFHGTTGLEAAVLGQGSHEELRNGNGFNFTGIEAVSSKGYQGDIAVRGAQGQVEPERACILGHLEFHIISLVQVHALNHIEVLTGNGNHITALVGGLLGFHNRRLAHSEVFGVDMVGDGVLVHQLVHVTEDDGAAYGTGRNKHLQLMAGLAHKLYHGNFRSKDHFADHIQVFTLDGNHVSGEDLCGREGSNFDGLGISKVTLRPADDSVLANDGDRTHFGAFQRNYHTDFGGIPGLNHLDIGHGDITRKADFRYLVQVAAQNPELSTAHDRIRSQAAKLDAFPKRVGIQLFLATSRSGHSKSSY